MKYFLAILLILSLTQCKEHKRNFEVCFWTSTSDKTERLLYINNIYKGRLPYSETEPDAELVNKTLLVHLISGKYRVEVKGIDGEVKFSQDLRLKSKHGAISVSSHISNNEWSSSATIHESRIINEIYY
jgi:hypothetical protein